MPPAVLRRTLLRHSLLAALVAIVVFTLTAVGILLFARQDAYRSADHVGRQVGSAVILPLSRYDFRRPVDPVRGGLANDVEPFLSSDMIRRVKVWTVRDGTARIAYSDEPRVEGSTTRLDPASAARLDAGDVVVQPVPDDAEHRYEHPAAAALLEVFIRFRDAGGEPTNLEVYVPVDETGTAGRTAAVLLPMVAVALLVVTVATVPLSVALARRLDRERREQLAARQYGLTAAETARHELARALHDGVIPDLASAGLLLDAVRSEPAAAKPAPSQELIAHAHTILTGELQELRALLDGLVPPTLVGRDLPAALHQLVERHRRPGPPGRGLDITVDASPIPALRDSDRALLYRTASELLRNVVRHAEARHVAIRLAPTDHGVALEVVDDGHGFDPSDAPRDGHIGLALLRHALADHGGHLAIDTRPGAGTTVTAWIPEPDRHPARGRTAAPPTTGTRHGVRRRVRSPHATPGRPARPRT